MSESNTPLSQVIGRAQSRAVQEALRQRLRAFGARRVEEAIGKPARFFENLRQRSSPRIQDFFATCEFLELDPAEFVQEALGSELAPDISPPRIINRAWEQIGKEGTGVGQARLDELEALLQSQPKKTRGILAKEITRATNEERVRILGLYGSCYRIESDLERAKLVLTRARELARELELRAPESDLLVRMAYVSLEGDRLLEAMRQAEKALVLSARVGDTEGEGIGFLTMGIFRLYGREYHEALEDLNAVLVRTQIPRQRVATHQTSALCYIGLEQEDKAQQEIEMARSIPDGVETWMEGKLSWTQARLVSGTARLELLISARDALSRRPADRALVMVELIEEALALGRGELAEHEALRLCGLLDRTGSPRVERAILHLTRHHTRLTPKMVATIRQAVDSAQVRRFNRLIGSNRC